MFSGLTMWIWAATWQNQQNECAPREDSDQPWHPTSLIRVIAVRTKKAWVLSYPLSAQWRLWSDWADAKADLSLCWVHTHFVGFVILWLICPCQNVLESICCLAAHFPQWPFIFFFPISFLLFDLQDYKTYLDFVLALENRKEPEALRYLFRILDVQQRGYLNVFSLNYFFRVGRYI